MRIKNIHIENFKGIEFLSFKPNMINVITGRNNSGKTSVLEAIKFCFNDRIDSIDSNSMIIEWKKPFFKQPSSLMNNRSNEGMIKINTAFSKEKRDFIVNFRKPRSEDVINWLKKELFMSFREYNNLSPNTTQSKSKHLKGTKNMNKKSDKFLDLNYLIDEVIHKLLRKEDLLAIVEEGLLVRRNGSWEYNTGSEYRFLKHQCTSEIINNLPVQLKRPKRSVVIKSEAEELLDDLMNEEFIDSEDEVSLLESNGLMRKNREPIFIRDPSSLIDLYESDRFFKQATALKIEEIIKKDNLVPGLKRFGFDSLVFEGSKKDVPMNSMGDGFKVLIGILSTLITQPEEAILLIEEPESHMHPGYIKELANYLVLLSMTKKIQLFITTHSIDLIQSLLSIESLPLEAQKFVKTDLSIFRLNKFEDTTIIEEEKYSQALQNVNELEIDLRGI